MELSNVLDRPTQSAEARYNYVERFLKNPLVHTNVVMAAYGEDLLTRLAKHHHTLVLMIDQNKVNATLEVLMVSVRLRIRFADRLERLLLVLSIALHWAAGHGPLA